MISKNVTTISCLNRTCEAHKDGHHQPMNLVPPVYHPCTQLVNIVP